MNMHTHVILGTIMAGALVGCMSNDAATDSVASRQDATVALAAAPDSPEGDLPVTLDECPRAVQKTIRAHLDGGDIIELERTTDHGEVLFEVDVRHDDRIVEFDVAENGAFRGYEADDDSDDAFEADDDDDVDEMEEAIPLDQLPAHIVDAALAAVPGIELTEAEIEREGDARIYEVEGVLDGVEYEIEIDDAGVVLEIETDENDD
jgi:uncharacterized membrane protein YkoI